MHIITGIGPTCINAIRLMAYGEQSTRQAVTPKHSHGQNASALTNYGTIIHLVMSKKNINRSTQQHLVTQHRPLHKKKTGMELNIYSRS